MQEHLFRNFSSPGHDGFLNDIFITFIDKKEHSDPLQLEEFWRETLITMAPFGLDIEGNTLDWLF